MITFYLNRGECVEDCKIVELFFNRSEDAIAELTNKYGELCNRVALHVLNDRLDAEECVNEAYLGVWSTVPPERPNPLRAYVCRIVRNIALKKYHANTAAKRNSTYDIALDELADCIPSASTTEDECDTAELTKAIDDFLGTLEREERVLFVRRYWYSDTVNELSARLGIKPHTCTVRLSRTREKLRKYLLKGGFSV